MGTGAALGAGTGLVAGSAIGVGNADAAGGSLQVRYDTVYAQCMTAKGNRIGGPAVVAPIRRGFGTDVTKRIVSRALRGKVTLDFAPGGLCWRLDVPTASLTGQD